MLMLKSAAKDRNSAMELECVLAATWRDFAVCNRAHVCLSKNSWFLNEVLDSGAQGIVVWVEIKENKFQNNSVASRVLNLYSDWLCLSVSFIARIAESDLKSINVLRCSISTYNCIPRGKFVVAKTGLNRFSNSRAPYICCVIGTSGSNLRKESHTHMHNLIPLLQL